MVVLIHREFHFSGARFIVPLPASAGSQAWHKVAGKNAMPTASLSPSLSLTPMPAETHPTYCTVAVAALDVPCLLVSVTLTPAMPLILPLSVNGCANVNWLP
jgi:hypothetical protein